MSSHGNNGIRVNIKHTELSGKFIAIQHAQKNTVKKLESQVKLYRIVTKESYVSPTPKLRQPSIFLIRANVL